MNARIELFGARVHYWLALSATIVAAFGWAVLS